MKILSNQQVRKGDLFTIKHEPISSFDLMKRASKACADWIVSSFEKDNQFLVFCGPGNNGGDGYCIAYFIRKSGYKVRVVDCAGNSNKSTDLNCAISLYGPPEYNRLQAIEGFSNDQIIIDSLFGSGLSRPLSGDFLKCVDWINSSGAKVISIDCPSGLDGDCELESHSVMANHTLVFEQPKLSFLLYGTDRSVGTFHILDIGISSEFKNHQTTPFSYFTDADAQAIIKPIDDFGYKGTKGLVAIIGGSRDTLGAPTLSARAAFRSGCGLVSVHSLPIEFFRHVDHYPEVMYPSSAEAGQILFPRYDSRKTYGIGPGLGLDGNIAKEFYSFLQEANDPLVIDADGLNLLAKEPRYISDIPKQSVLTPHLGELKRLLRIEMNEGLEDYKKISKWCIENQLILVFKSTYTCVFSTDGQWSFNSSGTPALSTAGSGDVLTGIITSCLAQGYSPIEAAILAVWIHGKAGLKASDSLGARSVMASDIIEAIPLVYQS